MPSPTIATRFPALCSRFTSRALASGNTSASTSSRPTSRAIARALWRLSPVTITTSRPICLRAFTVRRDPSFSLHCPVTESQALDLHQATISHAQQLVLHASLNSLARNRLELFRRDELE